MLTTQLDSQRSYYEAELEKLSDKFAREQVRNKEQEAQIRQQEEERVAQIEKAKVDHRVEKAAELAKRLEKELRKERTVSEGPIKNLGKLKEAKLANKEKDDLSKKVRELEDQVRDVMFFLEAKTKIEQGGGIESEAAGGSISVPTPPPPQRFPSAMEKRQNHEKDDLLSP